MLLLWKKWGSLDRHAPFVVATIHNSVPQNWPFIDHPMRVRCDLPWDISADRRLHAPKAVDHEGCQPWRLIASSKDDRRR